MPLGLTIHHHIDVCPSLSLEKNSSTNVNQKRYQITPTKETENTQKWNWIHATSSTTSLYDEKFIFFGVTKISQIVEIFQFLSIVLFFKMCSAVTPFVMSPNVIFEKRLQVDNGLFVFLSATENENYWCKLTERHLSLFLQGFEDVDPGMLYPACRHYFSRIHSLDYYYE